MGTGHENSRLKIGDRGQFSEWVQLSSFSAWQNVSFRQISCFYHNLHDSYQYLLLSATLRHILATVRNPVVLIEGEDEYTDKFR